MGCDNKSVVSFGKDVEAHRLCIIKDSSPSYSYFRKIYAPYCNVSICLAWNKLVLEILCGSVSMRLRQIKRFIFNGEVGDLKGR